MFSHVFFKAGEGVVYALASARMTMQRATYLVKMRRIDHCIQGSHVFLHAHKSRAIEELMMSLQTARIVCNEVKLEPCMI